MIDFDDFHASAIAFTDFLDEFKDTITVEDQQKDQVKVARVRLMMLTERLEEMDQLFTDMLTDDKVGTHIIDIPADAEEGDVYDFVDYDDAGDLFT